MVNRAQRQQLVHVDSSHPEIMLSVYSKASCKLCIIKNQYSIIHSLYYYIN